MISFATLSDALAARQTSVHTLTYVEGRSSERAVPYRDLRSRALALLGALQAQGAGPGSELVILVERNDQFIDTFWACQLGHIIAVPLATGNADEHRRKLFRVLVRLTRPHLLTDRKTLDRMTLFAHANGLARELARLTGRIVVIDELTDLSRPGKETPAQPYEIALVQFSSGSTSEPKGVALTHRNVLSNIDAIIAGAEVRQSDCSLSWMPLTHDMGLIGFHLAPLVADIDQYLMPTAMFVRRPGLWLFTASEKKCTVLCSPNFGYKHLLNNFDPTKASSLDLTQVRIVFNGAEPISSELAADFLRALAPAKLAQTTMFPVYGLAEATLAVTFPRPGTGLETLYLDRRSLGIGKSVDELASTSPDATAFVPVGTPVAGCEVQIGGDGEGVLPERIIGRVRIRGNNVTRGYYGDPAATATAIASDGWLDTGDLGFFDRGVLTITGRVKEIIFVGGQNFYPHDLESMLEKHAGVELGRAAVCGVRPAHGATDDVLVFVVNKTTLAEFVPIASKIRRTINEHAGLAVEDVIPVQQLPKTTSGKIQRFVLAQRYQDGEFSQMLRELHALAPHHPAEETKLTTLERTLLEICQTFLPDREIGADDNLFELGTSSLTLAQIYERIEAAYPGKLEVTDFFDYPTVRELAQYLGTRLEASV